MTAFRADEDRAPVQRFAVPRDAAHAGEQMALPGACLVCCQALLEAALAQAQVAQVDFGIGVAGRQRQALAAAVLGLIEQFHLRVHDRQVGPYCGGCRVKFNGALKDLFGGAELLAPRQQGGVVELDVRALRAQRGGLPVAAGGFIELAGFFEQPAQVGVRFGEFRRNGRGLAKALLRPGMVAPRDVLAAFEIELPGQRAHGTPLNQPRCAASPRTGKKSRANSPGSVPGSELVQPPPRVDRRVSGCR